MWRNLLETTDVVTFTVEILSRKLHCPCRELKKKYWHILGKFILRFAEVLNICFLRQNQ